MDSNEFLNKYPLNTKIKYDTLEEPRNDIINSHKVFEHLNHLNSNVKDINDFSVLTSNLCDKIPNLFGKHSQTFKGSEYNLKIWVFKIKNFNLFILTSKGYGTSYEVDLSIEDLWAGKYTEEIKDFLTDLHQLIT